MVPSVRYEGPCAPKYTQPRYTSRSGTRALDGMGTGPALATQVRHRWPTLPMVIYTGDVRDEQHHRLHALGVRSVLPKPFDADELRRTLEPMLLPTA